MVSGKTFFAIHAHNSLLTLTVTTMSAASANFRSFYKYVRRILLADGKMITADGKLDRISERRASPYPDLRPGDKPELLEAVMKVQGLRIPADDPRFSGKQAVQRRGL